MSPARCLALVCVLSTHAIASPRSDTTSGRAVFTGATMPHATSIELNPSALGLGVANEFYVAALGTLNRIAIAQRTLDIDTGVLGTGESVSDTLLEPGGMIAFVWHPGGSDRVTLGAALRSLPAETFLEDKQSLRYHTLGGSFRTYTAPVPTIAASLRVSSRFFVGISLGSQSSFMRLRYSRDTALEAGRDPARGIDSDCGGMRCGVENPLAEERYTVSVRSDLIALENVAANLGVLLRIARNVWLGVSVHTPPGLAIQNQLSGTMTVERAPRDGGGSIEGAATVKLSQAASVDAELRARLSYDLDLHVGLRFEHLSRLQAYDVRGYGSFFPSANIPEWQLRPRGFNNVWAAWAGVEQGEREFPLNLGARIGVESAALREERTSPTAIAPASLTFDAGAEYRLTADPLTIPQVVLQATYGLQYFPTVNVTNSAYDPRARLECYDSGYDYSTAACESVRQGYAIPTAAGEYFRLEQAARVALRLRW